MHKVQMNSSFNPEKVKKRITCFDEFDNGHVLHHYEKMSVADSEERARQASISDKTNVYYVSYDDIMEPCSDTYWFQGKSYDNSGARRALKEYRKTLTQNSSKRLNSAASADDLVKLSTVTLKRKLKNATPEEKKCIQAELNARGVYPKRSVNSSETSDVGPCFAVLWSAYIDDEYKCACCGKPFPSGHNSVYLGGHKPDGMHFIFEYTKENRVGNSVNYDPYNLPPEDSEGGIFKVIVGEDADDEGYRWLNFCRNCWPKLTSMSPEEIYAKYSPSINASKSCNSSATRFLDESGIMGIPGDVWSYKELAEYWENEQGSDPVMSEYDSYESWVEDTISQMTPLDSSRKKLNSATDPESPFYTATDAARYFLTTDYSVDQIERYLIRKGYSKKWIQNMFELMDDYAQEENEFDMFNSSRKPAQRAARKRLNSAIDWSSGYDHESIRPAVTALVERYLASVGASDALLKIGLEEDAGFSSEFNLGVYVYLKQDTDETIQEGLLDELTQKLRRVIMREYNWDATKDWIADNDYKMSVQIAVGDCYDNDTEFGYEIGYHSGIEVECPVDFDSSRKNINSNRKVGNNSMRKVVFRGKLNSSRKKLNSNVDSRFEKYFDKVTDQQLADFYGIDVEEIIDVNKDIENANYGKVVGHYIPKAEYADVLVDGDWESLDILDNGTVGFSLGEGGGKATRFYGVDIDSIKEAISKAGLDSSRKLDSARKPGASYYASQLKTAMRNSTDEWYNSLIYVNKRANDYTVKTVVYDDNMLEAAKAKAAELGIDISIRESSPNSKGMEGAIITVPAYTEEVNSSRKRLNSSVAETEVQDTGVDGGEDAADTAELLEDALIVQNPETKEVSLFVVTEDDETVPEDVDVVAEVTPVTESAVLDSSRRLKKFATSKLNSSKGCLNSDSEDVCSTCGKSVGDCTCDPSTVAYDEIQLPDDTIVEVENILVVKGEDDDLGLFMPEDSSEIVPEAYEVVAVATPIAEAEVLDSSRRVKKSSNVKKLNSSVKIRVRGKRDF